MKKIPTLFERVFENRKIVGITDKITPGCEDAFKYGIATVKIDGACCAIIDGVFYKRYDAKKGKKPPVGAIPCCDPDPVTGHWPHWVKVGFDSPDDKWFVAAYDFYTNLRECKIPNGTYEAIGTHFQGDPYKLGIDTLFKHGSKIAMVERTFDGVKEWLEDHDAEGLVFWLNDEPVCKIKRSDFGLPWGK